MEERIIEKEEGRKIKVTRTAAGGIDDAVEEGTAAGTAETEEVVLDLPEGAEDEYDEDLVGLTPSQLQRALEERKRAEEEARAECEKLLAEAKQAMSAKKYEQAETLYRQALVYDADCREAKEGVWLSATRNFEDLSVFYRKETAEALSDADAEEKAFIRAHAGERLQKERDEIAAEEEPLFLTFSEARKKRRDVFGQNRRYYLLRFAIFLGITLLFAIAAGVSSYFIVRTQSIAPVVLTIVFGALCVLALAVMIVFSRKLYEACRYCSANEKLSSTEEGKRLAFLQERLQCLDSVLKDE